MTKGDVDKLFALLRELYPRQAQQETAERKLAWFLALEPYDYDAVRASALAHARKSGYYPSVSEITAGLVSPSEQGDPEKQERNERKRSYAKYARQLAEDEEGRISISRYARDHGLSREQAKQELLANGLYARSEKGYPDSGRI